MSRSKAQIAKSTKQANTAGRISDLGARFDSLGHLYLGVYITVILVAAATLTIFPGLEIFAGGLGKQIASQIAGWGFDDVVRIVFVLLINMIPVFAWVQGRKVRQTLDMERSSATKVERRLDALIRNKSYDGLESFNEAAFLSLLAKEEALPREETRIYRLLTSVLTKATQRRLEPTSDLLQTDREYFGSRVASLLPLQKMCLQLGILMTFVGLAWAFSVSQMKDVDIETVSSVDALLESLSLAFSTSIAGLLGSVFILLFISALRKDYINVMQMFERCADHVYTFARLAPADPRFIDQVEDVASAVRGHADRAAGLLDKTDQLTTVISDGLGKLSGVKTDFDKTIIRIGEQQESLIDSYKAYVSKLDPSSLNTLIDDAANAKIKPLINSLNETGELLDRTGKSMESISQVVREMAALQTRTAADYAQIQNRLEVLNQITGTRPARFGMIRRVQAMFGRGRAASPMSSLQTAETMPKARTLRPDTAEKSDDKSI